MVAIQQCSSPVTEGDNVTFYCNATGNPSPNITWTRANSSAVISCSEMFHMEAVKRNESGSYICHASNGFGTHNTSCSVDVQCKLYWGAKGQGHVIFFFSKIALILHATFFSIIRSSLSWMLHAGPMNKEAKRRYTVFCFIDVDLEQSPNVLCLTASVSYTA